MIELYVLATLVAMGYLLNKSSQTVSTQSKLVSVNDIPSQETVYHSNQVKRARQIEQKKAAKMYELAKNARKNNVISKNYADAPRIKSLTGEYVDIEKFTHNNMVPFFGGNVQQNINEESNKSILETHTGVSELFKNKQEVPSMYDKSREFGFVNGMDNKDDFYRERLYESRTRNNVVPVPQVRVGPGLGQGYDAQPTGGFQQYEVQNIAQSYYKSVDDLRVANKPKTTFEGRTITGQKGSTRAEVPNLAKNRVETFFEQTPDMLLKTTGAYTKAGEIPEFNVKITNRNETTRQDIGIAGGVIKRRTVDADAKPTSRQQFGSFGLHNPKLNNYGTGNKDDYGKSKILVYNNERDITTTRVHQGNLTSLVKAIVAPLEDVMRINKKEHGIDNPRHFGNMNAQIPEKPTMYDPNDIARTTIKETLIHDEMGTGTITGAKRLAVYDPDEVAKTTVRETVERMDYELNLGTDVPRGIVYDPDDKTRTTMKETLVENTHEGNIDGLEGIGTYVNEYLARNTQKQFVSDNDYYGIATRETGQGYQTNEHEARMTQKHQLSDNDYYGTAGTVNAKKDMSKQNIENAVISQRKENTLYGREPTKQGAKVASSGDSVNLGVRKLQCDVAATRDTNNVGRVVSQIPTVEDLNITKDRHIFDISDERLDPSLLKPFNENPYTQSLHSTF